MNIYQNARISTKLGLSFGAILSMILIAAVQSLLQATNIETTVRQQSALASEKLEPLYVAREALDGDEGEIFAQERIGAGWDIGHGCLRSDGNGPASTREHRAAAGMRKVKRTVTGPACGPRQRTPRVRRPSRRRSWQCWSGRRCGRRSPRG